MPRPRSETDILIRLRKGDAGRCCIAFPFAGGSAQSMRWLSGVVPGDMSLYGIDPPGHGSNRGRLLEDLDAMAGLYLEECLGLMGPGTVFFGHSMGALAAYKCLELWEKEYGTTIAGLVISGMNPPVPGRNLFPDTGSWEDEQLVDFLRGLGGIPEEICSCRSFLDQALPAIKADLRACRAMIRPGGRLRVRAMVLAGRNDPCVDAGAVRDWQKLFLNPVSFHEECGEGHFFYEKEPRLAGPLLKRFMSAAMVVP